MHEIINDDLQKVSASLASKDFDSISQGPRLESCLHHLSFVKKKMIINRYIVEYNKYMLLSTDTPIA